MIREEEIQAKAEELYGKVNKSFPISEFVNEEKRNCFIAGAKWVAKEFADKVKRVSIQYKYKPDESIRFEVTKEMIYDRLLMNLIKKMKHDGFIEIKETQEDDITTIFMCINILKVISKKVMEE